MTPIIQKEITLALVEDFKNLKSKNTRYSLRAYAKRLGISAGSLSDIFRDKAAWKITKERAVLVLNRSALTNEKKNALLLMMGMDPKHEHEILKQSHYDILTDPTYLPILFSFDLPSDERATKAISSRLGLSELKVAQVVRDLIKRGLLHTAENGITERRETFILTSDNVPSEIIRKNHELNLDLSRRALQNLPTDKRDFSSLTFAGNEEQISFLREEIRKLHLKASTIMTGNKAKKEIFKLSVQLFPVNFENK